MKSFNRIRCLNKVVCELIDSRQIKDAVVADIATDHGYLAEQLSRNDKIKKVYATDISQKCLDKTNELVSQFHLEKIETRLGDGLDAIDVADVVIVAGIGGYETIKMLSNQNITKLSKRKSNLFVLQPSSNVVELRRFLIDENIGIISDFIVKSGGRFYPIIVADLNINNNVERNVFNIYFGKDNDIANADFVDYLYDVLEKLSFCDLVIINDSTEKNLKEKYEVFMLAKELIKNIKGTK